MTTSIDARAITSVNLKLIQAFLLVAEKNSFREAAVVSGRSNSAVSAQIRQLEQQIGMALFHRTTRRIALTPEGEQLLIYVKRSMAELHLGLRHLKDTVEMQRRRVSFSCSQTIAANCLPQILPGFARLYPSVSVVVHEMGSDGLLNSVRSGKSLFAIGDANDSPDLDADVFLEDAACALIPRQFAAAANPTITLKELARLPLVMLSTTTPMRALVEGAMRTFNVVPQTRYEFSQSQTLIRMAEAGIGATVLPSYVLTTDLRPTVSVVRILEPEIVRRSSVIKLKGQVLSPPAEYLVSGLKRTISTFSRDAVTLAPTACELGVRSQMPEPLAS